MIDISRRTAPAVDRLRQRAAENPGGYGPEFAAALSDLGVRLLDAGRLEEGLASVNEAGTTLAKIDAVGGGSARGGGSWARLFEPANKTNVRRQAVLFYRQAIAEISGEDALRPVFESGFGMALLSKHQFTGELDALQEAVDACRRAVENAHKNHPSTAFVLGNLGTVQLAYYRRTGEPEALDEALRNYDRAVFACALGDPRRVRHESLFGEALRVWYERTGLLADLDQAVTILQAAVEATPRDDADRIDAVYHLGNALLTRFARTGHAGDLHSALDRVREAADAVRPGDCRQPGILASLADALQLQFGRDHDAAQLEAAVICLADAMRVTSADHVERPRVLASFGRVLLARFERTDDPDDLDRAVQYLGEAVSATPPEHLERPRHLVNYASALLRRFEFAGNQGDLDLALAQVREAGAAPTQARERVEVLAELGELLGRHRGYVDTARAVSEARPPVLTQDQPDELVARFGLAEMLVDLNRGIEAEATEPARQEERMAGRLTETEMAELARLFPPGPATTSMFTRAGFDVTLLPSAHQSAFDYWSLVNTAIADGAFADGRRRVLAAARARYPYNPVLFAADVQPAPGGLPSVLLVGASPLGGDTVRADRELRQIREVGNPAVVEVEYVPAATAADLSKIRAVRPDLLHLSCHGQGAVLLFDDGAGGRQAVHAADIAITLRSYEVELGIRLRGIILNACDSTEAAQILSPYADVVVAHGSDIADDDAVAFTGALYRALLSTADLAAAARIGSAEMVAADPARRAVADSLVILERNRDDRDA